jgi:hypothetical protein
MIINPPARVAQASPLSPFAPRKDVPLLDGCHDGYTDDQTSRPAAGKQCLTGRACSGGALLGERRRRHSGETRPAWRSPSSGTTRPTDVPLLDGCHDWFADDQKSRPAAGKQCLTGRASPGGALLVERRRRHSGQASPSGRSPSSGTTWGDACIPNPLFRKLGAKDDFGNCNSLALASTMARVELPTFLSCLNVV